jgi:hypothetical protein
MFASGLSFLSFRSFIVFLKYYVDMLDYSGVENVPH